MFEFSVLIPVYYREKPEFLSLALESIHAQTLLPSEIVIVEDGPLTPELYQVIEDNTKRFPGLFTILRLAENQGMGAAMDHGLRNCKYNYVARMDSDDIAVNNRFEKQVEFLLQHQDIDVLGSYIEEFAQLPGDLNRFRKVPVQHEEILAFAKQRNPVNHMTVFMKKEAALKAGSYWHNRILEDYNLWYKMLLQKCRFHNLPESLVHARVGNNMVGRRAGLDYLKQEIAFSRTMLADKFINRQEFYAYSATRTILKLLPVKLLNVIYSKLLRK